MLVVFNALITEIISCITVFRKFFCSKTSYVRDNKSMKQGYSNKKNMGQKYLKALCKTTTERHFIRVGALFNLLNPNL